MKTKLVRPVLVETKEKSTFKGQLCLNGIYLFSARESDNVGNLNPQQLILISLEDEKIEVGNSWIYIDPINGIDYGENGHAIVKNNLNSSWFEKLHDKLNYHKVIATQDQISPEYIAKFVEQYNNGKIEDVEIKMDDNGEESWIGDDYSGEPFWSEKLEPSLTSGFITIVEKKEPTLYTEEEVWNIIVQSILFRNKSKDWYNELPNWFEQNKKK